DVAEVLLELAFADRGADLRVWIERIADAKRARAFGQSFDEAVVNTLCDDDPRRSSAALPGREEGAVDGTGNSAVEIGIIEHHERVLAAHFELNSRLSLHGAFADARADALRASEGDSVDAFMSHN